jgi:hypothetical protein
VQDPPIEEVIEQVFRTGANGESPASEADTPATPEQISDAAPIAEPEPIPAQQIPLNEIAPEAEIGPSLATVEALPEPEAEKVEAS